MHETIKYRITKRHPETQIVMDDVKAELIDSQNEIIHLQSECIDELFKILSDYLEQEETDTLPVVEKINEAARIRAEHRL